MKKLREIRATAPSKTEGASLRLEGKSSWEVYSEMVMPAASPQDVAVPDEPKDTAAPPKQSKADDKSTKTLKKSKSNEVAINPDLRLSLGYDNSELMNLKDFTQKLNTSK